MIDLRSLALLLPLAAACRGSSGSGEPVPVTPVAPLAASLDAGAGVADAGPDPAAIAAAADGEFRTLAEAVASRSGRRVVAWGTAELDEVAGADRFAVLMPRDDSADAGGAYVVETDASHRWVIAFERDGRTEAWLDPGDASAPRWEAAKGAAIKHRQTHRGGYESLDLAVRDGTVVVLRREVLDDGRSGGEPRVEGFARDGVCGKPCPALASFKPVDGYITISVHGPAASVDGLLGE